MPRTTDEVEFKLDKVGAIERIREDIQAVLSHDPAARSWLEVFFCYPGLHALWFHRLAFALWWRQFILLGRIVSHFARFLTGVEIHPGARIGRRVFIDHGMGVVVGETAVIEDDVIIYKGVLLGGTTVERTVRHPWIQPRVVIGSNACILGPIIVGAEAKIGSGSIVIRDVPEGATVVGVPGRAVKRKGHDGVLAHADLPDPIARALTAVADKLNQSERRIALLEAATPQCKVGGPEERKSVDLNLSLFDEEGFEDGEGI